MYYGLVYAAIHDIVAPGLRGTAMAVYLMAMYLGGASFGPLVTGVSERSLARGARPDRGAITEAARAIGLHQAMYADSRAFAGAGGGAVGRRTALMLPPPARRA